MDSEFEEKEDLCLSERKKEPEKLNNHGDVINVEEPAEKRETWGRKLEFVLTCVGYCVGLGNVWRFPYLTFSNGGGAFLIPYITMLFLCGTPLFMMELMIGQYFSLGPISSWTAICPLAKGVGFAMMAVSFLCTIYYNVIIAWVLYYMFVSMRTIVPWQHCGHSWNTDKCSEGRQIKYATICPENVSFSNSSETSFIAEFTTTLINLTASIHERPCRRDNSEFRTPSMEYWEREVLQISDSLDEVGSIRPGLLVALLVAWVLVFLCLSRGIKSTGKVVYFTATFPYFVLLTLLIRGAMLPGAANGISFFLKPDFSKLGDAQVWVAAATQVFYSLGIGFGSLIAFGSYNKFNNNVVRDAISLTMTNIFTSLFAGFVVFSVLGHMSEVSGVPVSEVATSGPGLVFVVYPEGLSKMPVAPLWSTLFFFMLFTIGIDTQFAMMEAVVVGFLDEHSFLRKYKTWFTFFCCFLAFMLGIPMVTQGGMYILHLFNIQSGGISLLFLALAEVLTIAYGYGADRFEGDLEMILKRKPPIWWKLCWKFVSPGIIVGVLLSSVIQWKGIMYESYKYPAYGEAIGWLLASASMMWIPLIAFLKAKSAPGRWIEKLRFMSRPDLRALRKVEREHNLLHRTSLLEEGV